MAYRGYIYTAYESNLKMMLLAALSRSPVFGGCPVFEGSDSGNLTPVGDGSKIPGERFEHVRNIAAHGHYHFGARLNFELDQEHDLSRSK